MINGLFGLNPYYDNYNYQYRDAARTSSAEQAKQAQQVQASGKANNVMVASRAASPDTPIQPVQASPIVQNEASGGVERTIPFMRQGADPAEMSVRMRMKQYDPAQEEKDIQKLMEDAECKTCAQRKYQDGSDDPGVSFKTAAHIDPKQAAATVRGHEMEHVVREQAKAEREDRKVVSQSVSLNTSVCPECGDVYVSGGTTRTTTAAKPQPEQETATQRRNSFFAIA